MRYRLQDAMRPIVESGAWAVVACAVWLATLSSVTLPELCFAIAASIPSGILAHAGRRALGASWRFRPSWLAWALPVSGAVVAELVELWRTALGRPRRGRLTALDLPEEEPSLAAGREAMATLALSATPGSIVADHDPQSHRLTVHRLLSAGPDVDAVVRR